MARRPKTPPLEVPGFLPGVPVMRVLVKLAQYYEAYPDLEPEPEWTRAAVKFIAGLKAPPLSDIEIAEQVDEFAILLSSTTKARQHVARTENLSFERVRALHRKHGASAIKLDARRKALREQYKRRAAELESEPTFAAERRAWTRKAFAELDPAEQKIVLDDMDREERKHFLAELEAERLERRPRKGG